MFSINEFKPQDFYDLPDSVRKTIAVMGCGRRQGCGGVFSKLLRFYPEQKSCDRVVVYDRRGELFYDKPQWVHTDLQSKSSKRQFDKLLFKEKIAGGSSESSWPETKMASLLSDVIPIAPLVKIVQSYSSSCPFVFAFGDVADKRRALLTLHKELPAAIRIAYFTSPRHLPLNFASAGGLVLLRKPPPTSYGFCGFVTEAYDMFIAGVNVDPRGRLSVSKLEHILDTNIQPHAHRFLLIDFRPLKIKTAKLYWFDGRFDIFKPDDGIVRIIRHPER